MNESRFHTVARVAGLREGELYPVRVGDTEMIVYRLGGEWFAAQRRCLHQAQVLDEGILSDGFVICPHHGWRYDARTGVQDAAPTNCLRTYATRVVGDELQVDPTPIWRGTKPGD